MYRAINKTLVDSEVKNSEMKISEPFKATKIVVDDIEKAIVDIAFVNYGLKGDDYRDLTKAIDLLRVAVRQYKDSHITKLKHENLIKVLMDDFGYKSKTLIEEYSRERQTLVKALDLVREEREKLIKTLDMERETSKLEVANAENRGELNAKAKESSAVKIESASNKMLRQTLNEQGDRMDDLEAQIVEEQEKRLHYEHKVESLERNLEQQKADFDHERESWIKERDAQAETIKNVQHDNEQLELKLTHAIATAEITDMLDNIHTNVDKKMEAVNINITHLSQDVKDAVQDIQQQVSTVGTDTARQITEHTSTIAERAVDEIKQHVDDQGEAAANNTVTVGDVLRATLKNEMSKLHTSRPSDKKKSHKLFP
jgi:chromosome segregation ATPase